MTIQEKLEAGTIYITSILTQNTHVFRQDNDVGNTIYEQLAFSPQQLFDSSELRSEFIAHREEKTISIVTDRLRLVWIFVCIQGWVFLIGPCRTQDISIPESHRLLRKVGLRENYADKFNLYYNTFVRQNEAILIEAAYAVIKSIYGDAEDTPIFRIRFESDDQPFFSDDTEPVRQPFATIEHTYDLESRYMQAVSQGNTAEASLLMRQIIQRTVRIPQSQGNLQDLKAAISGIAIARTLSRIAAKSAGVPSPALDALSSEFAQRALTAGNAQEINSHSLEMVERFCELVRQYRLRPYSPIVRKVIHHVLLNLHNQLTVEQIARIVSVSPNYLSSIFHKEVGKTLQAYIQNLRLEKASKLLILTTLSIQEIGADVGIPDNNYFAKVFRKKYGTTPSSYRNRPESISY